VNAVITATRPHGHTATRPHGHTALHLPGQLNTLPPTKVPVMNYVPRHEDVWGMEVPIHVFVSSALDGSGHPHAPASLTPVTTE
jgi:hypothetical protein